MSVEAIVQPKKKSWALYAMLIVSILPVAAAYTMFYSGVGVPKNTVNEGMLLSHAVHIRDLLPENDLFLDDVEKNKKWRLLLPVTDTCDAECQKNLFTTRQVHIRLSEKSLRLERIAVNLGGFSGEETLQGIEQAHPHLKKIEVSSKQWRNWLEGNAHQIDLDQRHYYLLVDQEGFAMMAYNDQHHGNQLLKDIKRALKYSIDYQ